LMHTVLLPLQVVASWNPRTFLGGRGPVAAWHLVLLCYCRRTPILSRHCRHPVVVVATSSLSPLEQEVSNEGGV